MDTFTAFWTFLVESVLPYGQYLWPFVTASSVLAIVGQVLRNRLWTRENAAKWRWVAFGRATIPAHPVLAGAALGVVWRNPCGDPWAVTQSISYFAVSGVAALIGYLILDKWMETKYGIDLDSMFVEPIYPSEPRKPSDPPPAK